MTAIRSDLKQYEQDILRARARVEVKDLDNVIDELIAELLGKLTTKEHREYQASRITGFIGATPEIIVAQRAKIMDITLKQITLPSILTLEELAELVLIMRAIAFWLRECLEAGETDLSFRELVLFAENQARNAQERFVEQYQRLPSITDVPAKLMPIARAQEIKRLTDRPGILLPAIRQEGRE